MGGSSSVRGDQTIYHTDNMCFDGTDRGSPMALDGQLWIGATASNRPDNGGHVRLGNLTPGAGISITNGPGSIIIANTGSITDLHDTRYIVSAGGASDGANFTTITSAITAASGTAANQTIMIQPGTYTENLTVPANINLCAHIGDELTPTVTIVGKITATDAGSRTISGIRLQTNSDNILSITGSAATIVRIENCYINATNATAFLSTTSNTGSKIEVINCFGILGTTGISYYSIQHGAISFYYCNFENGSSTTVCTTANDSSFNIRYCDFRSPISHTSSSTGLIEYSEMRLGGGFDTTCLTTSGTGAIITHESRFESGTASAMSIGAGTFIQASGISIDSSNTNVITGAGTITFGNVVFTNTSSLINTSTQLYYYDNLGKYKASGQPCFMAFLGATVADVTGDNTAFQLGTTTALTEVFDQDSNFNTNGTFTAPVTGRYLFACNVLVQQATALMSTQFNLVTSNAAYNFCNNAVAVAGNNGLGYSAIVDMDAADTMTTSIQFSGSTKTADCFGGDRRTMMSGQLLA